mmetsp:Transcript_39277/g.72503  ORF Transcript_39277/g.72503 Transcript_39277/m.72503 type:complete len:95 (-) Transcript_39277:591-875(-)
MGASNTTKLELQLWDHSKILSVLSFATSGRGKRSLFDMASICTAVTSCINMPPGSSGHSGKVESISKPQPDELGNESALYAIEEREFNDDRIRL